MKKPKRYGRNSKRTKRQLGIRHPDKRLVDGERNAKQCRGVMLCEPPNLCAFCASHQEPTE